MPDNQNQPQEGTPTWKILAVVFGGLATWELLQYAKNSTLGTPQPPRRRRR